MHVVYCGMHMTVQLLNNHLQNSMYLQWIFQAKEQSRAHTNTLKSENAISHRFDEWMSECMHCYSICLIFHHFEIFKWPYVHTHTRRIILDCHVSSPALAAPNMYPSWIRFSYKYFTVSADTFCHTRIKKKNEKNEAIQIVEWQRKIEKIVWFYDEVCAVVVFGSHVYASVDLFSRSHLFATFASQLAYARAFVLVFFVRSFIHSIYNPVRSLAIWLVHSYTIQSLLYNNTFNDANALTYRLKILCFRSNERIQSMHSRNAVVVFNFVRFFWIF